MAVFEIRTPALIQSDRIADRVLEGIEKGSLDPRSAGLMLGVARVKQAAVAQDVKTRLAAPRILAQEAQLVEQESERSPNAIERRSDTPAGDSARSDAPTA